MELVDWEDDMEEELQTAIDEDDVEKPSPPAAVVDLKPPALHPVELLAPGAGSAESGGAMGEATLIYMPHARSTVAASIHPLHSGSEDGASPAASTHPPPPPGELAEPVRVGATAPPWLKLMLAMPARKLSSPPRQRKPV